jgi:hypothetical protein
MSEDNGTTPEAVPDWLRDMSGEGTVPIMEGDRIRYVTEAEAEAAVAEGRATALAGENLSTFTPPEAAPAAEAGGEEEDEDAPVSIVSIEPASIPAGSSATPVVVTGTGFDATDKVTADGAPVTTTYVSSTELRGSITKAMMGSPRHIVLSVQSAKGEPEGLLLEITEAAPEGA